LIILFWPDFSAGVYGNTNAVPEFRQVSQHYFYCGLCGRSNQSDLNGFHVSVAFWDFAMTEGSRTLAINKSHFIPLYSGRCPVSVISWHARCTFNQ
jgi:hypothetical protein